MDKTNLGRILQLGAVLLALSFVNCQSKDSPCEVTRPRGFVKLTCVNITDIDDIISTMSSVDSPLRELSIVDSPLLTLRRDHFDNPVFGDLLKLNLLRNNMTTRDSTDPISGLKKLKYLGIQVNNLTALSENSFSGLEGLEFLFLDDNQIAAIEDGTFDRINNLTILNLGFNQLTTFSGNSLGLSNLYDFRLNNNLLTSIDENTFKGLPNLTELSVKENKIATIDSRAFQNNPKLKELDLGGNAELTGIPSGLFNTNRELEILKLSHSNMENITEFHLDSTAVEILVLESCHIQSIPANYFVPMTNLRLVSLIGNKLNTIEPGMVSSTKNLRSILLDHNEFRSLSYSTFLSEFAPIIERMWMTAFLPRHERFGVKFNENDWDCTTNDIIEIKNWLKDHKMRPTSFFDCANTGN